MNYEHTEKQLKAYLFFLPRYDFFWPLLFYVFIAEYTVVNRSSRERIWRKPPVAGVGAAAMSKNYIVSEKSSKILPRKFLNARDFVVLVNAKARNVS